MLEKEKKYFSLNIQMFADEVTYNSNGGSSVTAEDLTVGDLVTEPDDPTKGTDLFLGWYKEEALTTRFDFYNTTYDGTPFTLYAKWGSLDSASDENESRINYIGRAKEGLKEALTSKSVDMTSITDFAQYPRKVFELNALDTSDANALVTDILSSKTAYVDGEKVTGTMVDNGAMAGEIDDKDDVINVPVGYHNGTGSVQISSTEQDNVISGNIKSGITILGVSGATAVVDTSDANASTTEILETYTAYVDGSEVTGTMVDNGAMAGEIDNKEDVINVLEGYHNGTGSVYLATVEKNKLIAGNIKTGVTLLGVEGSLDGVDLAAINSSLANLTGIDIE